MKYLLSVLLIRDVNFNMYLFAQVFSIAVFVHDCDYIMLPN